MTQTPPSDGILNICQRPADLSRNAITISGSRKNIAKQLDHFRSLFDNKHVHPHKLQRFSASNKMYGETTCAQTKVNYCIFCQMPSSRFCLLALKWRAFSMSGVRKLIPLGNAFAGRLEIQTDNEEPKCSAS